MKESELQKAIMNHLLKIGFMVWRNNRGTAKRGKVFMRFGGLPGASDIHAIDKNGRFIGIEVKTEKKLPTNEQLDWIDRVNKQGGIAYWVGCWETWIEICEDNNWPA